MNISKKILAISAIAILAIGFGLGVYGTKQSATFGAVSYDVQQFGGDVYQAGIKMMSGGVIVGPLSQSASITNVLLGTSAIGNVIQGGGTHTLTLTTSTSITAAQFCAAASVIVQGTGANATLTLPSYASLKAAVQCGGMPVGSWSNAIITNHSTNTVTLVAGASTTIQVASGSTLTAPYTMAASSSMNQQGIPVDSTSFWMLFTPYK